MPQSPTVRVMLAGESWSSYGIHVKGASAYTTASYEEGADALLRALEAHQCHVRYLPNHRAVEEFPYTADELRRDFDVVILSDLPADSLLLPRAVFVDGQRRPDRLAALRAFAEAGGGLLMIGGYMSFAGFEGRARYGATALADALPVHVARYDDRAEIPSGFRPEPGVQHPITDGLPQQWPYFLGYNEVSAKDEADVLLWSGRSPILAAWDYGAGRVAAFMSDCSPHWGSPDFLAWQHYERFWVQLVHWLSGRNKSVTTPDG